MRSTITLCVLSLVLVAGCSSGGQPGGSGAPAQQTSGAETTRKGESKQKEPVEVSVRLAKSVKAMTIGLFQEEAPASSRFLYVVLDVKNNGNNPSGIDVAEFSLKVGNRTYSLFSSKYMSSALWSGGKGGDSQAVLDPGFKAYGVILFRVPDDLVLDDVTLVRGTAKFPLKVVRADLGGPDDWAP